MEKTKIEKTIQNYFQGYLQADEGLLSSAFHPVARLFATEDGKLEQTEMADWLKNIRERNAKGDRREARAEIASIEISGDAAIAKTAITFPTFQFVDYLSLLHVEGNWTIVNKIYTVKKNVN